MFVCVTADMEQVSDDELDHAAEEDSDKEDQDLDKMFGAWLGELDKLTQVTLLHSVTQCDVVMNYILNMMYYLNFGDFSQQILILNNVINSVSGMHTILPSELSYVWRLFKFFCISIGQYCIFNCT